jgi:hypothetical protein
VTQSRFGRLHLFIRGYPYIALLLFIVVAFGEVGRSFSQTTSYENQVVRCASNVPCGTANREKLMPQPTIGSLPPKANEQQSCSVEGTILDAQTRMPVADVEVTAISATNLASRSERNGRYRLNGLHAGMYTLFAKKEGYVFSTLRTLQLSAVCISVQNVDLEIHEESAISGRVVDHDNNSIVGAQVTVWTRVFHDGRRVLMVAGSDRTNKNGEYRIGKLTEGAYYLGVRAELLKGRSGTAGEKNRKPQLAYQTTFYPHAHSLSGAAPINLRPAEQHESTVLVVDKVRAFCITGSVAMPAKTTSDAITIMISEVAEGWNNPVGGISGIQGNGFEMCGLTIGTPYALTANTWESQTNIGGFVRQGFSGTESDAERGVLDIGLLSIDRGVSVEGKVEVDGSLPDQPIPDGVIVSLEPLNIHFLNESTRDRVDASGRFALPNVFRDQHWLKVSGLPSGYYVKTATYDRTDLKREPWRPSTGDIRIVLGRDGAALLGRVIDKDSHNVDDGEVILIPKSLSDGEDVGAIASRHVDQYGQFQFSSGLLPGEYYVVAVRGVPEVSLQNLEVVRPYLSSATRVKLGPKEQQSITLIALEP